MGTHLRMQTSPWAGVGGSERAAPEAGLSGADRGTGAAAPSRTWKGASGWSHAAGRQQEKDASGRPADGERPSPPRPAAPRTSYSCAARITPKEQLLPKKAQELLTAVRRLGAEGGRAGVRPPRKEDNRGQGRVAKRPEGGTCGEAGCPAQGPCREPSGLLPKMLYGRLSPGPVGMSRGPRGGEGRRVRGREHRHPLVVGHGAMALTVYSACFFPYHFIHFLNSRSMVCKGQNRTAGKR